MKLFVILRSVKNMMNHSEARQISSLRQRPAQPRILDLPQCQAGLAVQPLKGAIPRCVGRCEASKGLNHAAAKHPRRGQSHSLGKFQGQGQKHLVSKLLRPGEFLHLSMPKKLLKLGPGRTSSWRSSQLGQTPLVDNLPRPRHVNPGNPKKPGPGQVQCHQLAKPAMHGPGHRLMPKKHGQGCLQPKALGPGWPPWLPCLNALQLLQQAP